LILGDRDLVLFGEGDQRRARGETPLPPRRDDPDVGLERIGRKLEPHLVVALAGRPVRDRVGADLARDLDQALGDQGPRDRGAEQVLALVRGVGYEAAPASAGLIDPRAPYANRAPRGSAPRACQSAGQPGACQSGRLSERPSASMIFCTSTSGGSPASTMRTGSSGEGSSSVSNWLLRSEAGMYS